VLSDEPGSWRLFDQDNQLIALEDQNMLSVSSLTPGGYNLVFTLDLFQTCTETINFTVIDDSPIFENLPPNITVSCEEVDAIEKVLSYTNGLAGPCAISGSVDASISGNFDVCGGSLQYLWEYTDDDCNLSHPQLITITSVNQISFSELPDDITANCDNIPEIKSLEVTNEIDGNCQINDEVEPDIYNNYDECGGTILVEWIYNNCDGDLVLQEKQNIIVESTEPEFEIISDITLGCGEEFLTQIPLAYSNYSELCLIEGIVMSTDDANYPIRTYTWSHENLCSGNIITESISVTLLDQSDDKDYGVFEVCDSELANYNGPEGWQEANTVWGNGVFENVAEMDGCEFIQRVEILILESGDTCTLQNDEVGILNSNCDCVQNANCESQFFFIDSTLCEEDIWYINDLELSLNNNKIQETYIDSKGCDSIVTIFGNFVSYLCTDDCLDEDNFLYPSGFTPNGDGVNDLFVIIGLTECAQELREKELIVFNRWGVEIYFSDNYANDWDGTDKAGEPLPEGTYYYTAILDGPQSLIHSGYVVILR
jgi:gliding motility-associated-like protein